MVVPSPSPSSSSGATKAGRRVAYKNATKLVWFAVLVSLSAASVVFRWRAGAPPSLIREERVLQQRSATRTSSPSLAGAGSLASRDSIIGSGSALEDANTAENIRILCEMSGGMGNHLDLFAHCLVVKRMLLQHFGVSSTVAIRAYKHGRSEDDLKACFPRAFENASFSEGSTAVYETALLRQQELLRGKEEDQRVRKTFVNMTARYEPFVVLDALQSVIGGFRQPPAPSLSKRNGTVPGSEANATASTADAALDPMSVLHVQWLFSVDESLDTAMDEFRELLEYAGDNDRCCRTDHLPDADETVWHLRNFIVEMPNRGKDLGFEDLSPERAVCTLFSHLRVGDKVAIVSRFAESDEHAKPYIDALERRGIKVRLASSSSSSGMHDFCFLMRAQKEVIGMAISTFFMWSAFLGDCSRIVAYAVDVPERRRMFGDGHVTYNFTNPILANRFYFPLISPAEEEAVGEESNLGSAS